MGTALFEHVVEVVLVGLGWAWRYSSTSPRGELVGLERARLFEHVERRRRSGSSLRAVVAGRRR